MDVSIIIVNWKVKQMLRDCLFSIYRETKDVSFEIFVVDNDSRDGSVEMVLREFPEVQILANNRNLGFAAGNNPALRAAEGDFIFLLNPDTQVVDHAIEKMIIFMKNNHYVGICGSRLLNVDGTLQPSVQHFPTFMSQVLVMLKLHHVFPGCASLRYYVAGDFDYKKTQMVDQIAGAAMMIRRSVFDAIGLFDERFFIWFEEVDFCKRAKNIGIQIWYIPEATIRHDGGQSFGQVFGPQRQRMFNESLRKYFLKHHGLLSWFFLSLLHPFSMLLSWPATLLKKKTYGYKR